MYTEGQGRQNPVGKSSKQQTDITDMKFIITSLTTFL